MSSFAPWSMVRCNLFLSKGINSEGPLEKYTSQKDPSILCKGIGSNAKPPQASTSPSSKDNGGLIAGMVVLALVLIGAGILIYVKVNKGQWELGFNAAMVRFESLPLLFLCACIYPLREKF